MLGFMGHAIHTWNWGAIGAVIAPAVISVGGLYVATRNSAKALRSVTEFQVESTKRSEQERRDHDQAERARQDRRESLLQYLREFDRSYEMVGDLSKLSLDKAQGRIGEEEYIAQIGIARKMLRELKVQAVKVGDRYLIDETERASEIWREFMLVPDITKRLDLLAKVGSVKEALDLYAQQLILESAARVPGAP